MVVLEEVLDSNCQPFRLLSWQKQTRCSPWKPPPHKYRQMQAP